MALTECSKAFQEEVSALSELSGKSQEAVYAEWLKYSAECTIYDQSPVMFEFCEWYGYDQLLCE